MKIDERGGSPPAWATRTDLAVEAHQEAKAKGPLPGIMVDERQSDDIHVQRVQITSEEGASRLGKPCGTYVTLQSPGLLQRSRSHGERVAEMLAVELADMLRLTKETSVLLVGLGNWNATPDALGPRVVSHVLVTRHLGEAVPPELKGELRCVTALSPGVLGLTGIETGEIVRGVVREIHPDRVVCVDALAAQDPERLATTIQLADTGIRPGSGVGNHRAALTEETLGVPTLAIGVPTVVHAMAIVEKSLSGILGTFAGKRRWARVLQALAGEEDEDRGALQEALYPTLGRLMVTPKDLNVHDPYNRTRYHVRYVSDGVSLYVVVLIDRRITQPAERGRRIGKRIGCGGAVHPVPGLDSGLRAALR